MVTHQSRLALIVVAALLGGCGAASGSPGSDGIRLEAISTRPHLITGGDVLVAVDGVESPDPSGIRFALNGSGIAPHLQAAADGRWTALIEGLQLGDNELTVTGPEGSASLSLTNWPASGPIISGPQEQPFVCQTEDFELASGQMLGAAKDENCSVERRVDYVFRSTDGEWVPWTAEAREGAGPGVATTTTLDGRTVPFIVRVETGTLNRAVYEIAMLHDPANPEPSAWQGSDGWNGKLVYTHGGGCRSGWFQQGNATGGVLNEGLLGVGYAVTSSTLNVFGQNCNDLLASETHIMVKERFVEGYGVPAYTISIGASGGSYQSHQTADNYPGIFDGIIVSSSFPDVTSATIFTLADARLLYHYFADVAPGEFSQQAQQAVSGFGSFGSIANLSAGAARLDPTWDASASDEMQGGEMSLDRLEALRYSASNPGGLRGTVYDHTVNVYGRDPETGFALRPLDNVGVQYGLAALNEGAITPQQFVDLNRGIGGFDRDLNPIGERHHADEAAVRQAISSGRILYGGAGLAQTPVIDYRSYTDHRPGGDIHMIVHQFSTRARLAAVNGNADNHVMAVGGQWGYTDDRPDLRNLFVQMDRWLTGVAADTRTVPARQKVLDARPADLVDMCWDGEGADRTAIQEPLSFDATGRCAEIYPAYRTPRQVAGAPLANNVVACTLKPVDPTDYEVALSDGQIAELREIFAEGVCDWEQGERFDAEYGGTWQSFGPAEAGTGR